MDVKACFVHLENGPQFMACKNFKVAPFSWNLYENTHTDFTANYFQTLDICFKCIKETKKAKYFPD